MWARRRGIWVTTLENQYDNNSDEGDGLLTKTTVLVDSTPGNNRVADYTYDWRQRRETASISVTLSTGGSPVTLITENTYDNRSLVIEVREYQDATGAPGNLLGQVFNFFDPLGRNYRVERFKVDPGQSTSPADFLYDQTWSIP